jgi:LysM repeat protein
MQINHEEARRLIQFKADNNLSASNEKNLSAHLEACKECRAYSNSLKETEAVLRQTMHKQWGIRPLPLQMDVIYAKVNSRGITNNFVTTRTALIGLAFVMFAFVTWQSITNNTSSMQPNLSTVPLIPTPSTQYTATNTLQNDCKEIKYVVQEGDTLESVSQHFSVSKETIAFTNHLTDETLASTRELVIPICESTPTSTTHPPTFTITPMMEIISTTPG